MRASGFKPGMYWMGNVSLVWCHISPFSTHIRFSINSIPAISLLLLCIIFLRYWRGYCTLSWRKEENKMPRGYRTIMYAPKKQEKEIVARVAVREALRHGTLKRGLCAVCGVRITDAHHEDYDQPLYVRWLCGSHHKEHHISQKRREGR